jgi:hypothetical protein
MSALGNGSITGSDFKQGGVLPSQTTTATQPVPTQYNSKLVGGKKRRLSSLRSVKRSGLATSTFKLGGGKRNKSKKSRKSHRKSKKCMSFWPF